jgi:hypothetical protein
VVQSETATARVDTTKGGSTRAETVVYVYGVVPGDVEENAAAKGVGDPPSRVGLVRSGKVAALVGEIAADAPLGTPEDLTAHARILDSVAGEVPVMPLRFGAVVTTLDAVEQELLAPNADAFAGLLRDLEGRAQFIVRGRYVEDAMLRELMKDDAQIEELREQIRSKPQDATRDARIALGERIGQAVQVKRDADTHAMARALDALGFPVVTGEATHEWDAVNVAALVELSREEELRQTASRFAEKQEGRITLRLLGPMAAYDFVPAPQNTG